VKTVPFSYYPRTRLIFGANSIDTLGELVREYGGTRVLLVTDSGIVSVGHAQRAENAITKSGLQVVRFDGVGENPTTRHVDACVQFAKKHDIDFIVGLGGGSSMDTAKGANFILSNGGRMADYWGVNKAARAMLPFIAIPTTAGTGSECQSYALIADDSTHQKMACGDDKAYARVALLDPVLTLSQPQHVAANTGIDTITHALEAHVTAARNPISQVYSRESWKLAEASLETVLLEPQNLEARGQMLLASAYGGMAIAQSMLGAVHAAANPLTAHFNIVHGQAVGLMLTHVVRYNAGDPAAVDLYADLVSAAGLGRRDQVSTAVDVILQRLDALLAAAHIPENLHACHVHEDKLPTLAAEAAKQWTATFNPRVANADTFLDLYRNAMHARRPAVAPQFSRQRRRD
jgi:alcohol dehydrogenase